MQGKKKKTRKTQVVKTQLGDTPVCEPVIDMPTIVPLSFLPQRIIGLQERAARRISGMLRYIIRCKPKWEGSILTPDCINYIGKVGAPSLADYRDRMNEAVLLNFEIDVHPTLQVQMSEQFTPHGLVPLDIDHTVWNRYSISYRWFVDPNWRVREQYFAMAQYVLTQLPTDLLDENTYGLEGDSDFLSFGDEEAWAEVKFQLTRENRDITVTTWINN